MDYFYKIGGIPETEYLPVVKGEEDYSLTSRSANTWFPDFTITVYTELFNSEMLITSPETISVLLSTTTS